MSSLRLWMAICGVLLVGVGGAVGFLAGRRLPGPATNGYADPFRSGPQPLLRSEEVWKELGLSDDQKSRLVTRLEEHYKAVRDESGQVHAEVLAVLTPEQRGNLDRIESRYIDDKIESDVLRKMAFIRRKIGLPQEKEADVYKILFDGYREKHAYWRQRCRQKANGESREDRKTVCRKMEDMYGRMEQRLGELLGQEWLANYKQEQRKHRDRWRHKKRGKDRDARPDP